jgi:transcriptional regulator with XRE-family HTH domain
MRELGLDEQVRRLLERRRGEWQAICQEAEISHSWISQFTRGLIPNPGIQTLRRLHDVLTEGASK